LKNDEERLLTNPKVIGVVLYGRNILGTKSTQNLIRNIKSVRKDLQIAVDEEGGIVSRFTHLIPNYSQPYCATIPVKIVRRYYKQRSEFLKTVGIDLNFAPLVDIAFDETSSVYKRAYGGDVDKIIELSSVCIEEQKKVGLLSCLKHFPGHGRSAEDSHRKLPVINIDMEEWMAVEGKIFHDLIAIGVEYVMVGHILFPKINPDISSVSRFWVNEILKRKLNYKGNIISDDICMEELDEIRKIRDERPFREAGQDQLIITGQGHPLIRQLTV
jgi:beta-N-acetylhexosaminidase